MLQQEFGALLLGFTSSSECDNCHNSKPFLIYQEYVRSRGYVVVPLGTQYGGIYKFCHICEKKLYLLKNRPLFSSKQSIDLVITELENGKEYTKKWFSGLSNENQELVLKRLNSIGAYRVVTYLGLTN